MADTTASMRGLLYLWQEVLRGFGWRLNPEKTQFFCTNVYPEPIEFEGCSIEPSYSFKWLGCILTSTGVATDHVEHRISLALAAWQLLNNQFSFSKLRFKVKSKLYMAIIEPIMLHGVHAYALTTGDLQKIYKAQNMVQRTFVSSRTSNIHERWIQIHARLKVLRNNRALSDSISRLLARYVRRNYSQEVLALVDFRGREWTQRLQRRSKERRRMGRPALTLQSMLHGNLPHWDDACHVSAL